VSLTMGTSSWHGPALAWRGASLAQDCLGESCLLRFSCSLWGERGPFGGFSISDNCQLGLLDTSVASELNGGPKSTSCSTHMVLLASAPLPGLQRGLAAQEGPCSTESDHAWSSPSQVWWGWRRPTTHPSASIALTMQELNTWSGLPRTWGQLATRGDCR